MAISPTWHPRSEPPVLGDDVVHVWRVPLDVDSSLQDHCQSVLNDEEQQRADRFRASRQTQRFVVARGTLRHLLGVYLETDPRRLTFTYGEHGKPQLASCTQDLHFNVSHSGGVALMAFVRGREVGVDVERTEREVGWERVARRFFAGPELEELMALPAEQRRSGFFRCWTSKEAYMKATGRGITLGLGNFAVRVDPARPAKLLWLATDQVDTGRVDTGQVDDWWLAQVDPGPGTAGALCLGGGPLKVETYARSLSK